MDWTCRLNREKVWLFILVTLFVYFAAFGFWGLFLLIFYFTIFAAAFLIVYERENRTDVEKCLRRFRNCRLPLPARSLPNINMDQVLTPRRLQKQDRRYTGSCLIDEPLREIVDLIIRDYILSWYSRIGPHDSEFVERINVQIQKSLIFFSDRCKETEWTPYLTTRFVDDIANHLRLYKQANEKTREHLLSVSQLPAAPTPFSSVIAGGRAPSPHPTPAVTREHWEEELLSRFFDAEVAFERRKSICRDEICTEPEKEIAYLGELSEVLLYLIMPEDDFPCKPLRYLLRELLIHSVFLPTIDLLSDPDYLNQTIIWLCKGVPMTSDAFLTSIRVNTCPDEIDALLEKINAEITFQRSRDSGGDSDTEVKQQLSSLLYLKRCAEARKRALKQRETGVSPGLRPADLLDIKLPDLSLTQILGNNIALSYFSEFLDGVGGKHLMALLLNIECWRVTAEQTIQAVELAQLSSVQEGAGDETSKVSRLDQAARRAELEPLRVPALMIFEHYLSEAANPRVRLNDDVVRDLHYSLKTEIPSENWFNVIVALLREKFGTEPYLPSFKRSSLYIALLEELDLLRLDQAARGSDDEDQGLPEEVDLRSSSSSLASFGSQAGPVEPGWQLSIESLRINSRGSKQFALYKVVGRRILPGREEIIDPVFRRYSDFYDFHQLVISKYPDLSGLYFPEKKAFNNLDSDFLRARRSQLDQYLRILVSPAILSSHPKLQDMICAFLECEGYVHRGMVTKILDPLKTSVRSVGSVVRLGASALTFEDGFFRVLSKGVLPGRDDQPDGPLSRLQSGTQEFEETIPLRILTLVLDEVFEVRTRDQLLRSYLVDAAKGFIKAMFGDVYNRRILEFVDWLTSAEQVKEYLKAFKHSLWPSGSLAMPQPERDQLTKLRTKATSRAFLLSVIPDDLKRILGSETTKRGVLSVHAMLQHAVLNRRLAHVILEGILVNLFPQNSLDTLFSEVHGRSARVFEKNSGVEMGKVAFE